MELCLDSPMYQADSLQEIFEHNYDFDRLSSNCWQRPDSEYLSGPLPSADHCPLEEHSPVKPTHLPQTSTGPNPSDTSQNVLSPIPDPHSFANVNYQDLNCVSARDNSLPTPPHSPPTEYDLDNIIASIPEILEYPPNTLFPAVEDVLHDLENSRCPQYQDIKPYSSSTYQQDNSASSIRPQTDIVCGNPDSNNLFTMPLRRDSMWGSGSLFSEASSVSKKRRHVSGGSDDYNGADGYSDDEFGYYMPETPCVSDEDLDYIKSGGVSSPKSFELCHSTAGGVSSSTLLSPKSVVKREHNYCGDVVVETLTTASSDEEIDVDSWSNSSATSANNLPTSNKENSVDSSTEKVKKQLKMVIHESIRCKQRRIRSANNKHPLEDLKLAVEEANSNSAAVVVDDVITPSHVPLPSDVCGAKINTITVSGYLKAAAGAGATVDGVLSSSSINSSYSFPLSQQERFQKFRTRGKPEAYTKRMREQHEDFVKSKRRKMASDDSTPTTPPVDNLEKRSFHNIMERNRRVNIRNLFDNLRVRIPATESSERASKVVILKKSRQYIEDLKNREETLTEQKDALTKVNLFLQNKLRQCIRSAQTRKLIM